jgi:peptidoglycan hydrolase-like protein with peptidoglycan-binding domain
LQGSPTIPSVAVPIVPSPSGKFQRTVQLQRHIGARADGIFGPETTRRCRQNMVGWRTYVARMNRRVPHLGGNSNRALVSWVQEQGVRKGAYPANGIDGLTGPKTNHVIVVALKQRDGICGPLGYRQAVS